MAQDKQNPKDVEKIFSDSAIAPVPSSLPLIEASNILSRGANLDWQTDPDGRLSYSRNFGSGGEGAIHFWVTKETNLPPDEKPTGLATAAALAVINSFDLRAACMHLIYAAYASQNAAQDENPWDKDIVIDDRQLEKYLGLQKRTDLNRKQKLTLIKDLVEQPCKITTFVSLKSTARQKGFTISEGRLWHLVETRYHYQQGLLDEQGQIEGMTFVIRPGSWAQHYLSEGNKATTSVSKYLLEKVMGIWQHREGAARLMLWLIFQPQRPLYSVEHLMEIAYGRQRLDDAQSDRKIRARVSNAWDEDLLFLHDQNWALSFDENSYPLDLRPLGFGRTSNRRQSGFFDNLLNASISISPPPEWSSPQISASEHSSSEPTDITPQSLLSAQEVKEQRTSRGWSQRYLAKLTGISQSRISRVESGKALTSDENEKIVKAFSFM